VKISTFDNDGCIGSAVTTTSVDSGKCRDESKGGKNKMSSRYTCAPPNPHPAKSAASTPLLWTYPRYNGKWHHTYGICFHVLLFALIIIALLG